MVRVCSHICIEAPNICDTRSQDLDALLAGCDHYVAASHFAHTVSNIVRRTTACPARTRRTHLMALAMSAASENITKATYKNTR